VNLSGVLRAIVKKYRDLQQNKCITNALHSDSDVVSYAARYGIYYGRMLSPIGRNAYFCCSRYGVSLYDSAFITKDFVRSYVRRAQSLEVILTVRRLLELLYVRHGYSSLSLFIRDELFVCYLSLVHSAADLGMFSMFGRTGAPTKGAANFCMPDIMGDPRVNKSDEQRKRSPVFSGELKLTADGDD